MVSYRRRSRRLRGRALRGRGNGQRVRNVMPIYHALGQIPRKRHSIYRQASGRLFTEELMGNMGFTGDSWSTTRCA